MPDTAVTSTCLSHQTVIQAAATTHSTTTHHYSLGLAFQPVLDPNICLPTSISSQHIMCSLLCVKPKDMQLPQVMSSHFYSQWNKLPPLILPPLFLFCNIKAKWSCLEIIIFKNPLHWEARNNDTDADHVNEELKYSWHGSNETQYKLSFMWGTPQFYKPKNRARSGVGHLQLTEFSAEPWTILAFSFLMFLERPEYTS